MCACFILWYSIIFFFLVKNRISLHKHSWFHLFHVNLGTQLNISSHLTLPISPECGNKKKTFFPFIFFIHLEKMSNFINSLLYGFTNILSVGPEEPKPEEESSGCGSEQGCCKDQSKVKQTCQTEATTDACCSSSKEPKQDAGCCSSEPKQDTGYCSSEPKQDTGCCSSEPKQDTGCCSSEPKKDTGCQDSGKEACACEGEKEPVIIDNLKIIFSTLTGTAKTMASEIENKVRQNERVTVNKIDIMDITEYDNDNLLQETAVCVFILSTYNVEGPLDW